MSTFKEYKNENGIVISLQQANNLEDYYENIYENNRLKRSILYWDREVQNINIYIYSDENLITELNKLNNNTVYTIVKDIESVNNYTLFKYFEYKNGVLETSAYATEVFDSNNRSVAYKSFSSNKIRKIYYLDGKHVYNEEEELDFTYDKDDEIFFDFENGNLKINVSHEVAEEYFTNIGMFHGTYYERLPFMTPEILAYFTNQEPLVPPMQL